MSLMEENSGIPATMLVGPTGYSGGNGGNGGGWGNDWSWIIVIFLFAIFGGWGGGFGGGYGGGGAVQGALTRGDLCMDMSFQDLKNEARNTNDAVNLGFANLNSTICHQQYDTAMLVNGVSAAVNGGFSALNSTICQQQYDTAAQLNAMNMANMQNANAANVVALQNANAIQTQLADCCCKTQSGIEGLKFTIANEDCATRNLIQSTTQAMITANNDNTRAILDKLTAQEIAAKDAQIAAQNQKLFAAELAASQAQQNSYLINTLRPTPVPAYPASSPCGIGNWSAAAVNSGCGCNNGCGSF